jgi:hypothetical protein
MGPLGIGWARMSRHRNHPLPASFRIGPSATSATGSYRVGPPGIAMAGYRAAAPESDEAPHDRLFLEAVIAALDALMILIARDQKDRMCVAIGEHSPSSDFAAIIYEIACDHG